MMRMAQDARAARRPVILIIAASAIVAFAAGRSVAGQAGEAHLNSATVQASSNARSPLPRPTMLPAAPRSAGPADRREQTGRQDGGAPEVRESVQSSAVAASQASLESGAESKPLPPRSEQQVLRRSGPSVADEMTRADTKGWGRTNRLKAMLAAWMPLMVVLALIVGLVVLAKRYLPNQTRARRGVLEVLATHAFSSKQSISLVKVGRRIVLIGQTPERVSALSVIEEAEEVAELVGRSASSKVGSIKNQFASVVEEASQPYLHDEVDELPLSGPGSGTLSRVRGQVAGLLGKVRGMRQRDAGAARRAPGLGRGLPRRRPAL